MNVKAKDSPQVQKAHKKLKKQLAAEEKLITSTALDKMDEFINRWIARNAKERIQLKRNSVTLFDENKHSAKNQNRYIYRIIHHLKTDLAKKESLKPYKGRILPN
jgi:hypothetical protein